MSCTIRHLHPGTCVCECHGIRQIVPVAHCKVLSRVSQPQRVANQGVSVRPSQPMKWQPVVSISNIGVRLQQIIERQTQLKIECGECKSEILRLNKMTANAVLGEIDSIADGIIRRGMRFGKWYHQLANAMAPGMIRKTVQGWVRQAVLEDAVPGQVGKSTVPVSVIISCHNYEHFLPECLQSIYEQTVSPAEIVIVDDSSTVPVGQYPGCRTIRIQGGHLWRAKEAGLAATTAPLCLFVDADNKLTPEFLELSVKALEDTGAAIAYPDKQNFGDNDRFDRMPREPDLSITNCADTSSLFRRSVWEICQPTRGEIDRQSWEDFRTWKRIRELGFQLVPSGAVLQYRVHGASLTARRTDYRYSTSTSLYLEPVTLCIPMAGRWSCWNRQREWLSTLDPQRFRGIIYDTSQSSEFHASVREFFASWPDCRIIRLSVAPAGLADMPRAQHEREVQLALCRLWNRLRMDATTDYVVTLEDDIIPPVGAVDLLLQAMKMDVGVVIGPYVSRYLTNKYCHWYRSGRQAGDRLKLPDQPRTGVEEIRGSGFGFDLIRRQCLVDTPFDCPQHVRYYDPYWFDQLDPKWRRLVVWEAECEHLTAR